jgi:uncharacterized protein YjiS (DUF1127 family)
MHITTIPLRPGLITQAHRALQGAALGLGRLLHRRLCAHQAQATARVLSQLDDRVLRDLGLSRSELLSAAAELHGLAARDRRPSLFGALLPR